jgi:hypothetical protein
MTDALMTRLRAADPLTGDDPARDDAVWQVVARELRHRPAAPPRRRWTVAAAAALTLAVLVGLFALGFAPGGTSGNGGSTLDAGAKANAALGGRRSVYHFFSVSRLAEDPHGESFTVAFRYPIGFATRIGKPAYEEYWIAADGSKVRGAQYRGPQGPANGTIRSFTVQIPIHDPSYIRGAGELDPVHAFRAAYRAKLLHSIGATTLAGVPAWRFTAKHGKHGLWQEWIVDRRRWLPLRYRYVDHNRQGRYKVTNRLTIRFLRFEVLRG